MSVHRSRGSRGFTLLELLVVVAIVALIAAIATMSYLAAIDRSKQKRTVNDIRQIAAAWEARASDVNAYTVSGASTPMPYTFPPVSVTFEALSRALTPTYTRTLPSVDGWNHAYEFAVGEGKRYAIRSKGRDGQTDDGDIIPGETEHLDCDIIYANGSFVTYPNGVQKK